MPTYIIKFTYFFMSCLALGLSLDIGGNIDKEKQTEAFILNSLIFLMAIGMFFTFMNDPTIYEKLVGK